MGLPEHMLVECKLSWQGKTESCGNWLCYCREMFGDDVLGSVNIKMVEVARSLGASSKFTGSGGAVVALCPDGEAQAELLHKACQEAGFVVQQIKVAPSVLSDEELTSLSTC